jgi:two-component system sensor histidine kinase SenX3
VSVAPGRRGAVAFFITFSVSLIALAAALNVGWMVLTWRQIAPLLFGMLVFAAIIAGLIVNTTFLVREIRRNEQHDAFVNAVTHGLKTPVTSIRLHLETLAARGMTMSDDKRREFYAVMLEDTARLMQTIDQILRTGQAGRTPLSL